MGRGVISYRVCESNISSRSGVSGKVPAEIDFCVLILQKASRTTIWGLTAFDGKNSWDSRSIACLRAPNSEEARASVPHRLRRLSIGLLGLSGTCFPQKMILFLWESSYPRNKLFLGPSTLIIPDGISIGSAVFVWVPNAMLYNALSVGKKTPKTAHSLGISSPYREKTEPRP